TSDMFSFILEIKNGNFKSFKLENGWIGKKTSQTAIAFISSNPIKPGESATFEIKTDQQNPSLAWKALDVNNNELGSGQIGNQHVIQGRLLILDSSMIKLIHYNASLGYD